MIGRRLVLAGLAACCAAPPALAHLGWRHHLGRSAPIPYHERPYPELAPLLPSGFTMTITRGAEAVPSGDDALERPRDVARRIAACWQPPDAAGDPAEITLRLQFARDGRVIGEPRVTYVKATPEAREQVIGSMREALRSCAPLRFTASLGAAIAGYPFAIRFIAGARGDRQPKENADGG